MWAKEAIGEEDAAEQGPGPSGRAPLQTLQSAAGGKDCTRIQHFNFPFPEGETEA